MSSFGQVGGIMTVFNFIFLYEYASICIKISLKYDPEIPVDAQSALIQVMAWRRKGDKPLAEPMLTNQTTHIWYIYASPGLSELSTSY